MADHESHVAAARGNREMHERRVRALQELIRRAEAEVAVHEALIALARDDRLLAAVSRHHKDPSAVAELIGEGQERAISLPPAVKIDSIAADAPSPRLTARLRCGDWDVKIGWEPERGFFAEPDTRRLRQMVAVVNFVDTTPVCDEDAADSSAAS